jgi:prepilin-type processing-associated H-X9-DG protein
MDLDNSTGFAWIPVCTNLSASDQHPPRLDSGKSWMLGRTRYTAFYVLLPPNSMIPDCGDGNGLDAGVFTARSYHPGGVNAAMGDGSVRWFTSTIDVAAWHALGTRRGNDVGP